MWNEMGISVCSCALNLLVTCSQDWSYESNGFCERKLRLNSFCPLKSQHTLETSLFGICWCSQLGINRNGSDHKLKILRKFGMRKNLLSWMRLGWMIFEYLLQKFKITARIQRTALPTCPFLSWPQLSMVWWHPSQTTVLHFMSSCLWRLFRNFSSVGMQQQDWLPE